MKKRKILLDMGLSAVTLVLVPVFGAFKATPSGRRKCQFYVTGLLKVGAMQPNLSFVQRLWRVKVIQVYEN